MIHIIIPSYEAGEALNRCLDSVMKQTDQEFKVVLIDDASTTRSHRRSCSRYVDAYGWMLIRNTENMKCPYTIKQGIEASGAAEDDVILLLDGDDFLTHVAVEHIKEVYEKYPQLWLTYGSYQPYPDWTTEPRPSEYPTITRWNRDFRTDIMRFNHPITFRRFLWDALEDVDLQDNDGNWFTDGYDQVIMSPMLEMAGADHYAFLDEVLYYYYAKNPLSEWRLIEAEELIPHASQVRDRPKKELLIRG
jgi:glycosyltransferase involved in cell wall biosynthesis